MWIIGMERYESISDREKIEYLKQCLIKRTHTAYTFVHSVDYSRKNFNKF